MRALHCDQMRPPVEVWVWTVYRSHLSIKVIGALRRGSEERQAWIGAAG